MRAETLFWLVTWVLAGSVVLYAVARVALWMRHQRQAKQLEDYAASLSGNDGSPDHSNASDPQRPDQR